MTRHLRETLRRRGPAALLQPEILSFSIFLLLFFGFFVLAAVLLIAGRAGAG